MLRKIKNIGHALQADIAKLIYTRGKTIPTIGVTGTDGKTTTASLIFHILKSSGYSPAIISTVGAQIGENQYETGLHTTTPSPFVLQNYISKAIGAKSDYLVLEITSHALDQNRAHGIKFEIGVLTNITHEHLDYHKTYENYALAKSKLFRSSNLSILNRDDESYKFLKSILPLSKKIYTYSQKGTADFTTKSLGINIPAEFDFNIENFLAAASVANLLGIDDVKIQAAINSFEFPKGRQEIIYDRDFRVVVDFAHTPNSFTKVLPFLKKNTKGRLIHIFGSAGLRDMSKRPLMGKIAAENDDVIILTAEDPRSEKIEEINEQIKMGIKGFVQIRHSELGSESQKEIPGQARNDKTLFEIPDRQEAINFAIKIANKGDTVVATGKGHELSMNLGKGEIPWSDQEAFEKAIALRRES